MIIEFFGPPASGKTTFAVALTERLRSGGLQVRPRLSARPGEGILAPLQNGSRVPSSPVGATARRLLRPACELIVAAAQSPSGRVDSDCTDFFARGLARGGILRFLRMKQYMIRLADAWGQATKRSEIWIFDQAYVQVIATIMLYQPHLTDADLLAMLDIAPKSDLVVFVKAPVAEVEMRLGRRKRFIGIFGRLFEEDLGDVRRQAEAAARLNLLLTQSGRRVLTVNSSDGSSVDVPVDGVRHAIRATSFVCEAAAI